MDPLEVLRGVIDALRCSLPRHVEAVVHDLQRPEASIVAILNGHVSGRHVHQSILAVPAEDRAFADMLNASDVAPHAVRVVNDYTSYARNGTALRSSSVLVHDGLGRAMAALCINADMGAAERLHADLGALLLPTTVKPEQTVESETTLAELESEIIEGALGQARGAEDRMTKPERVAAVAAMRRRGLFLLRGSVDRVAKRLGTTKFTIYNYIEEIEASAALE